MPGRPRQHELETVSRRAFEGVLPGAWVARAQVDDYGVDYHVEVFQDQHATGLIFGVQLKATGRLRSGPSVRLRWRTRRYWSQLDLPVLVVLWEAESGQIWWHWAHRFDPWGLDTTGEEFTFPFPPDQLWDRNTTPDLLVAEVEAWRAWHRGIRTPIDMSVSIDPAGVGGVPPGRLLGALRRRFAKVSDVFELRTNPRGPVHLTLKVTGDATVIWVAGGPSNTLHHENAQWAGGAEAEIAGKWTADVLLLAAMHLSRIGLLPAAARVAGLAVEDASMVDHPTVAQDTVHLLVGGNRLDDAFRLIGRLTHSDVTEAAVGALIGLLESSGRLHRDDQERVVVTLLGWADANDQAGELGRAAQFTYWAARFVGADDPPRAIQLFERAAERDPGYRQRDYWHREVAGMFFLSGNFAAAAEAYRGAMDLGNAEARPLLADAVMFSGRYQEALDQFGEVIANEELSQPEWRLKHHVLGFLTRTLGIGEQTRRVEEAARSASDDALDRNGLLDVLKKDALAAEALYRTGEVAHQAGERSVEWFVASALAAPRTTIAWFAGMAFASVEAPDLFEDVARCARRFSGDDLIQFILERDETGAGAAELVSLFEGLPPDPAQPLEVRLTTPGSSEYAVIRLADDESSPAVPDDGAPG